jgi:lysophospholipase L1-like esterase
MKRVVLIGDSIRMGYQDTVRAELGSAAEVWSPSENGGHTVNVLIYLNEWVLKRQPDIVHINCGLHDLKTLARDDRENLIPVAEYKRNVGRILRLIQTYTRARIIWAATTPVHEERIKKTRTAPGDFRRYEADVVAYNEAAREEAKAKGVPLNDLYAKVMAAGRDESLTADGVHFTKDAYTMLGKAAAEAIRPLL